MKKSVRLCITYGDMGMKKMSCFLAFASILEKVTLAMLGLVTTMFMLNCMNPVVPVRLNSGEPWRPPKSRVGLLKVLANPPIVPSIARITSSIKQEQ